MSIKDLVDIAVLVLLYVFVFYKKWKREGKDKLLAKTLMYVYLGFVLFFTLMPIITSLPFIFSHPYKAMNLTPFIDVSYGRGDFVRQIVLNVIMMIPFGFLLPLIKKGKTNFIEVVVCTFLLSFAIEIIQPLMSDIRMSDITDIITNVTGGMIGYVLYVIFRPLTNKILGTIESYECKD